MARGLQHADAQDLSQQVLMAVASAISTWEKRHKSTRFRHWLSRVTKNAILNALTRRPKDQAIGGSSVEELLLEVADRNEATTAIIENQLRRELYLQAAELIKAEFRSDSWQAFELSVTGELTIDQVAQQLGKSSERLYRSQPHHVSTPRDNCGTRRTKTMTSTKQHCSNTDRLLTFLRGQVSAHEEAKIQQHLDDCVWCRESLESTAADAHVWDEARKFFGNGALHASSKDSSDELDQESQGSQRLRAVLDSLGPTDDPESLGRIGGYEVTGVIGAGGMGVVLKAHDRSLDRIVAIKVMSPHLASSGAARKRFAREAKAAAAVLHPNVIAVHSVASEDANPYLVMQFVRGASLQKRIDSQGPLPLRDTLRIGSQIAAGLAAAHEQGLVHRDIKPANILLEEGVERVTLTDFGLARAVDDASMTCSGVIAGTPQYMSPEQVRGEPLDARSDLFSLGGVLYVMCTGRSPFRAETTYGVLHRIANDNPTSVCEVNTDVPVGLVV